MSKKINRQLIQNILSKGEGVKSVSSEAVDWVISVAEAAAKQLAVSGRRTPGGRLMAPKLDCGLMARHITKPQDQAAAAGVELAQDPGAPAWGPPGRLATGRTLRCDETELREVEGAGEKWNN